MKLNLLLFWAVSCLSLAKTNAQVSGSAHINFELPIAYGEYRNISDRTVGAGGRLMFYLRPGPKIPVEPGLSIGLFGRGSSSETFRVEFLGIFKDYKVKASNAVANFGFCLKIDPLTETMAQPYFEGEIGGNVFFSNITVEEVEDGSQKDVSDPEATKGHWGSYVGGAAGLKLKLGSDSDASYGLDFRCGYYLGSKVKYNSKPVINDLGEVSFTRLESKTNMLIPQLGFWVAFGGNKHGK